MDPLSYSENVHVGVNDIAAHLFASMGLPSEDVAALDAHSTIALRLEALPEVMLSVMDDRLWLWSLLPSLDEDALLEHAAQLMPILLTPLPGVEGGHATLGLGENGFEFKALVRLSQLQSDTGLATTFQAFVTQLSLIQQLLSHRF